MKKKKVTNPYKNVSASTATAIKELTAANKLGGLTEFQAGILYSKFKETGHLLDKDIPESGLVAKAIEQLEDKGLVEYEVSTGYSGSFYELTYAGNEIIMRIESRIATRRNVKAGSDVFPELAGVGNVPAQGYVKENRNRKKRASKVKASATSLKSKFKKTASVREAAQKLKPTPVNNPVMATKKKTPAKKKVTAKSPKKAGRKADVRTIRSAKVKANNKKFGQIQNGVLSEFYQAGRTGKPKPTAKAVYKKVARKLLA